MEVILSSVWFVVTDQDVMIVIVLMLAISVLLWMNKRDKRDTLKLIKDINQFFLTEGLEKKKTLDYKSLKKIEELELEFLKQQERTEKSWWIFWMLSRIKMIKIKKSLGAFSDS